MDVKRSKTNNAMTRLTSSQVFISHKVLLWKKQCSKTYYGGIDVIHKQQANKTKNSIELNIPSMGVCSQIVCNQHFITIKWNHIDGEQGKHNNRTQEHKEELF